MEVIEINDEIKVTEGVTNDETVAKSADVKDDTVGTTPSKKDKGEKKPLSRKKVVAIVVVCVAAVAAIIIGVMCYMDWQTRTAFDNGVKDHVDTVHVVAIESVEVNPETLEHDAAIEALKQLNAAKEGMISDQSGFKLYDGDLYRYDELMSTIDSRMNIVREWLLKSYQDSITSNTIDPSGAGRDTVNANISALTNLKTQITTDAESAPVWNMSDGENGTTIYSINDVTRDSLMAQIDALINADNDRINAINEQEAAEAAAAEAAAAAAYSGGGYYGGGSGGSYNGGGSGGDDGWAGWHWSQPYPVPVPDFDWNDSSTWEKYGWSGGSVSF